MSDEHSHSNPVLAELEQERRLARHRYEQTRLERDRLQIALQGLFQLALETELEPFCTQALELIARISGAETGAILVVPRVFGDPLPTAQGHLGTLLRSEEEEVLGITPFRIFHRRVTEAEQQFISQELFGQSGVLARARLDGQSRHLPDEETPVRVLENYRQRYVQSALILPFAPDSTGKSQAILYLEHCVRAQAFKETGLLLDDWIGFVLGWLHGYAQRRVWQERQDFTVPFRRVDRYPELAGRSQAMASVLQQLELFRIQPLTLPVLLVGEAGTGRETIASVLHRLSPHRQGPFLVLRLKDASQDPVTQLFGQEGDARQAGQLGLLERCRGGTLYISDIDLLPISGQRLLVRALQENRFARLGGALRLKLEVRLICSSTRPLLQGHREGSMLENLAEYLSQWVLPIPTLRERKEDIPTVAEHLLLHQGFRATQGQSQTLFRLISVPALRELEQRTWPGNLTELRETLLLAWSRCDGWGIEPDHLGPEPRPVLWGHLDGPTLPHWHEALDECQRQLIRAAMERTEGRVKAAAGLLGISRQYLNQRLNALQLAHVRRGSEQDEDG